MNTYKENELIWESYANRNVIEEKSVRQINRNLDRKDRLAKAQGTPKGAPATYVNAAAAAAARRAKTRRGNLQQKPQGSSDPEEPLSTDGPWSFSEPGETTGPTPEGTPPEKPQKPEDPVELPNPGPPKGTPPEGSPPEGSPPEGTPPEGSPPEGTPPEGSPPGGLTPDEIAKKVIEGVKNAEQYNPAKNYFVFMKTSKLATMGLLSHPKYGANIRREALDKFQQATIRLRPLMTDDKLKRESKFDRLFKNVLLEYQFLNEEDQVNTNDAKPQNPETSEPNPNDIVIEMGTLPAEIIIPPEVRDNFKRPGEGTNLEYITDQNKDQLAANIAKEVGSEKGISSGVSLNSLVGYILTAPSYDDIRNKDNTSTQNFAKWLIQFTGENEKEPSAVYFNKFTNFILPIVKQLLEKNENSTSARNFKNVLGPTRIDINTTDTAERKNLLGVYMKTVNENTVGQFISDIKELSVTGRAWNESAYSSALDERQMALFHKFIWANFINTKIMMYMDPDDMKKMTVGQRLVSAAGDIGSVLRGSMAKQSGVI
jgi:hypothetical protein